jgi:hypothetical protein
MSRLRTASGDNGLMDSLVIDIDIASVVRQNGIRLVLGDRLFDRLDDLNQFNRVEAIVWEIMELYGVDA